MWLIEMRREEQLKARSGEVDSVTSLPIVDDEGGDFFCRVITVRTSASKIIEALEVADEQKSGSLTLHCDFLRSGNWENSKGRRGGVVGA